MEHQGQSFPRRVSMYSGIKFTDPHRPFNAIPYWRPSFVGIFLASAYPENRPRRLYLTWLDLHCFWKLDGLVNACALNGGRDFFFFFLCF